MCINTSSSWSAPTTKKITVTERIYDEAGNVTKETVTVTETTSGGTQYYQPYGIGDGPFPPYQVTYTP